MKPKQVAMARRIKNGEATHTEIESFWKSMNSDPEWEKLHGEYYDWLEAEKAKEDGEARDGQAAGFEILMRLIQQLDDHAAAQVETAQAQAAVAKTLTEAPKTLTGGLKELADKLARPRTREGVVELPTGKVKMTIRETRQ